MPIKNGKSKINRQNSIHIMDYNGNRLEEKSALKLEDCLPYKQTDNITWINIDRVPPISFLQKLQLGFDLHPVVVEDILNANQRPKIEILDEYIYLVFKMLTVDAVTKKTVSEQVSLILSAKFLITLQQGIKGDTFEATRELLRKEKTRIRALGTDYLAYELIDSVVNNYFTVLEEFSNKIEKLELEVVGSPTKKTLKSIYHFKQELLHLRKIIWPMRELINVLERGDSALIKKTTRIYLRDIYERLVQLIDTIETHRDILSGMVDVYLSSLSQRANAVMKVLTTIATIFMPLSFLAGFYGMNFRYLPGLDSPMGPIVMTAIMFIAFLIMMIMFMSRKWR